MRIGTDIVAVSRIEKLICREDFLLRVFTKAEQAYILSKGETKAQSAAGIFCAKEAFSKAVGSGMQGFSFTDIEVAHDENGRPFYKFSDRMRDICKDRCFELSISHEKEYAVAMTILY